MTISLDNVIPIPLKDKFSNRKSDVWNNSQNWMKGEKIKIEAPSGTGKTTFMNILYKLRYDYEGTVKWDGSDIRNINDDVLASFRQQKISVIFQDLRLFSNLTALENIELKRVLTKPYYNRERTLQMAEILGVTHILDQKAGICSYGEQQRIAIARALVQPFTWLIMDEPFSHLDNANTTKAANLIAEECAKREAGFVLTDLDHDTHFAYTKTLRL